MSSEQPRFDIQGNLQKYLPVLFELLAPRNISNSDWLKLNRKLEEYVEQKKKEWTENGGYLRVEANIYGIIIDAIKGDRSATKMYEFIYLTLLDLESKLSPTQKEQIRDTIYKMLVEFNRDYRNFLLN